MRRMVQKIMVIVHHLKFHNKKTKTINKSDAGIGFGNQGFLQINCPIADCYATDNRSLLSSVDKYDAILFHLRTFNEYDLPSRRSWRQRWIFWSLESPQYNMRDIFPLNGLFNWTMTYRLSSDIVQPYGWLEPLTSFASHYPNLNDIIKASNSRIGKSSKFPSKKLVAWFVSNCESKSRREKYVEALAKYVQVDIYGGCGPLRCTKNNVDGCYEILEQNYKFYLSFENSFCDDYVTEKFFSILRLDVVPVVFGGANYSAMAPPFSYIDATRFKTARHLAEYLKILDSNEDYYNQYFWWKSHYRVRNRAEDLKISMCGLCSRLHLDQSAKVYDDMEKWWTQDSRCFVPRKDNVFRTPYWEL